MERQWDKDRARGFSQRMCRFKGAMAVMMG